MHQFLLADVVLLLADKLRAYQSPAYSKDACLVAAVFTYEFLREVAMKPEIYETAFEGIGHYFILVNGFVLDFTARQFLPDSEFPMFKKYGDAPEFYRLGSLKVEEEKRMDMITAVKVSIDYAKILMEAA